MSAIYLQIDGQQAGPFDLETVRRMLAEGKISGQTLAWYQGLSEWTSVERVLTASPQAGATPPPVSVIAGAAPAKKGMSGLALGLILAGCGFAALFVFACLAGIALGPITNGIKKAKESMSMQTSRAVALAMFQYANDHQGTYPDGKTSTEVFQKLVDGNYISDPGLFYIPGMAGKSRATSKTLTADNVCYDVTGGVTSESSDLVPLVFCTGYTVTYTAGAAAMPDSPTSPPFPGFGGGISVAYKSNNARFIAIRRDAGADGSIPNFVPENFSPGTITYRQLKP